MGSDLNGELLACSRRRRSPTRRGCRGNDHQLFLSTVAGPGAERRGRVAAKGTKKALALATDGARRASASSTRVSARGWPCAKRRNVACSGARPLTGQSCLNFGDPEHPGDVAVHRRREDERSVRALRIP
jgi:phosphoribosylformylglycinamidine (FGAM) synthase-like enzyme